MINQKAYHGNHIGLPLRGNDKNEDCRVGLRPPRNDALNSISAGGQHEVPLGT